MLCVCVCVCVCVSSCVVDEYTDFETIRCHVGLLSSQSMSIVGFEWSSAFSQWRSNGLESRQRYHWEVYQNLYGNYHYYSYCYFAFSVLLPGCFVMMYRLKYIYFYWLDVDETLVYWRWRPLRTSFGQRRKWTRSHLTLVDRPQWRNGGCISICITPRIMIVISLMRKNDSKSIRVFDSCYWWMLLMNATHVIWMLLMYATHVCSLS